MLLKRLQRRIIIWARRVKLKSSVQLDRSSKIDLNSSFEGYNKLEPNVLCYNSSLGRYSYIARDSELLNTKIGRFVSIGPRVRIIFGQHPLHYVSTHPVFYSSTEKVGDTFVDSTSFDEYRFADAEGHSVVIGNDVWIGADVRIIEGVTIGDGAVILAGALVAKDIPSYAIVGGVPAKIKKFRFSEEVIAKLADIKWWNRDTEWLRKNAHLFNNVNLFLNDEETNHVD